MATGDPNTRSGIYAIRCLVNQKVYIGSAARSQTLAGDTRQNARRVGPPPSDRIAAARRRRSNDLRLLG
jgi:hypothetical protein